MKASLLKHLQTVYLIRTSVCPQWCLTLSDRVDCSCQAPLSMDFPGKNTGVGCHSLLQGIFPDPGIVPLSPVSPALQVDSLPLSYQGSPVKN